MIPEKDYTTENRYVGVAALILKPEKKEALFGIRGPKCRHGKGRLGPGGGKFRGHESAFDCVRREIGEEQGFEEGDLEWIDEIPCAVTPDDIMPEDGMHFSTLYYRAIHKRGIPAIMEPDKCLGWNWYSWSRLDESKLFIPVRNLVRQRYNPFHDLK